MKGSRLANTNTTITTTSAIIPTNSITTTTRAKTATSTSTHSISLPREHYRPRTRPGHPVSLISFPSTTITTSGNDTTAANSNSLIQPASVTTNFSSKVLGPISTKGWRTRELHEGPEEEERVFRVPKPSHSAKKLAKPMTIFLPVNAMTERSAASGIPFLPSSYAKFRSSRHAYNVRAFLGGEELRKGENSPSGSSNNIDNKIGNKPRRNKTATPVLRKGLTTPKSRISRNSSSRFVGSGKKVIVNSTNSASTSAMTLSELQHQQHQQHYQSDPFSVGLVGDDIMNRGPRQMGNVLTSGSSATGIRPLGGLLGGRVGGTSLSTNNFQVNRTPEERDQSPESIRLDGVGLKTFPLIGGGEGPCLKLLSLQHNLITRLENVSSQLNHLVVLDLYDNRLERITGLQGLTSLRVLLLGKNRIRRIEGLEGLKRLEILDLHGNQLRYVDNLGSLSSLRVLNLAGNLLRSIRNLGPYGLSSLVELNLKRNRIRNLDGLQKAPHLKKLLLANNELRKLVFLQELLLQPNPLCAVPEYTSQVLTVFPWLNSLDRSTLSDQMRIDAKLWHRRKLAEDEERRKEETRLRVGSPNGVGPPGSREQTIYQARRRWQSVKNFVKNTNSSSSKPTNPSSSTILCEEIQETLSLPKNRENEGLIEYQREMTGLNNLDLDLGEHEESTMVSCNNNNNNKNTTATRSSSVCPPLMINDLPKPTHREDYVNTNLPLPSPSLSPQSLQPPKLASSGPMSLPLLSSESRQMDSAITNIRKEAENSQSLGCQQPGDDQPPDPSDLLNHDGSSETHCLFQEDEDEIESVDIPIEKEASYKNNNDDSIDSVGSFPTSSGFGESKSMRIAVVRPVVRETNLNETIPSSQLNTNSTLPSSSTNTIFSQPSPSTSDNNTTNHTPPELKKSSKPNNNEDHPIKGLNQEDSNDFCDEITNQQNLPKSPLGFQKEMNHEDIPLPSIACNKPDPNTIPQNANATLPIPDSDLDNINYSNNKTLTPPTSKTSNADIIKNTTSSKRNLLKRSVSTLCLPTPKLKDSAEVLESCSTFQNSKIKDFMNMSSSRGGRIGAGSSSGCDSEANNAGTNLWRKPHLRNLRSASFDGRLPSSPPAETDDDYYYDDDDDDDTCSIATSTNTTATTSDLSPRTNKPGFLRRQLFPRTRSQRLKLRDRIPRIQSSSSVTSRKTGAVSSSGGTRVDATRNNRQLRRCDSAIVGPTGGPLDNSGSHNSSTPLKKQGTDYLVEIEGKVLSIYGQGALKHTLTGFGVNSTSSVTTAKFHYISFDSIIPYFGKLRQIYPSLDHFQFRANNICIVSQLNALADLQGLSSLHISKEGNPLVSQDCWVHYASYRLSHWGLQNVNGKEVCSEYRGGQVTSSKCFESLGFLSLSCLPQTALTPLAKRLHMLHCFCCCSPSSSSEESGKGRGTNNKGSSNNARPGSPTEQPSSSSGNNICTSWDDDPVLLDVIGKEALVYCPPPGRRLLSPTPPMMDSSEKDGYSSLTLNKKNLEANDGRLLRRDTLKGIVNSGIQILEKLDILETTLPSLMSEMVQEILMDYMFVDNYMKKELKKCQDSATIARNNLKLFHKT